MGQETNSSRTSFRTVTAERDAAIAERDRLRRGMSEVRALLSGLREESAEGVGGYAPDVEAYVTARLDGIVDRLDAILRGE